MKKYFLMFQLCLFYFYHSFSVAAEKSQELEHLKPNQNTIKIIGGSYISDDSIDSWARMEIQPSNDILYIKSNLVYNLNEKRNFPVTGSAKWNTQSKMYEGQGSTTDPQTRCTYPITFKIKVSDFNWDRIFLMSQQPNSIATNSKGCDPNVQLSWSFNGGFRAKTFDANIANPGDVIEVLYLTDTGEAITPSHCGSYHELVINYTRGIANFTTEFYRPSYCDSSKVKVAHMTWIFRLDQWSAGYDKKGSFNIPNWGHGTITIYDIRDAVPFPPNNGPKLIVTLNLSHSGIQNYSGPVEFNP